MQLGFLLVSKQHAVPQRAQRAHGMDESDVEYAHARLFFDTRRRMGTSRAFAAYLKQSELSSEVLMSKAGRSTLTAAMLATVCIEEGGTQGFTESVLASNERVREWLAQTDRENEPMQPPCLLRCFRALAACPVKVCP